jgi:hypothetical protein
VILIGDNFRLSPGAYEFYSLSKTAYSNTIEDSETEANIVVMLNNEQLTLEQKPVFNGNEIFVPLFPIFEGLDAAIFYHKDNGSIICLTRDGTYIKPQAGTNRKNQFRIVFHDFGPANLYSHKFYFKDIPRLHFAFTKRPDNQYLKAGI